MGNEYNPTKLRVMPEYGSSGIWAIGEVGPFRHSMIEHHTLSLPTTLAAGFNRWIDLYRQRMDEIEASEEETERVNQIGRELAKDLKKFLGPNVYVEFVPELPDGDLGEPEIIE